MGVRKRKDRPGWLVDYPDASGKRIRTQMRGTHAEAKALEAKGVLAARQATPRAADPEITVAAYGVKWLVQITPLLEPKTVSSYRELLHRHILPTLGHLKVRHLHGDHVRDLVAAKHAAGLSKNTVRLIKATLSVLLGDAVEAHIVPTNPVMSLARRGRRASTAISQVDQQEHLRPLTATELAALLGAAAIHAPRDAVLFLLYADTGVRPSEGLGLRWDAVNTIGRTMRVIATKTRRVRDVDLTRRVAAALDQLQAEQEADALMTNRPLSPYVFPTPAGLLQEAPAVGKRFGQLLRRAGLPQHRLYDLRHSFATNLLALGAPITFVAHQMGHSTPSTTLAHYARWLPSGDKIWIDKLEAQVAVPGTVSPNPWHRNGTTSTLRQSKALDFVECRGSSEAEQLIRNPGAQHSHTHHEDLPPTDSGRSV